MASSSVTNSTGRGYKYGVFISFRGEDTCNNFTSHLHAALCRRKIETFIDYELGRGEEISPTLLSAIEKSSLSIVILSQNYAASSWCLDELLKIIECKNTKGQIIIPVFYHIMPSDVRKQTGSYGEAFANHEKQLKKTKDKVQRWRAALTQVANLSGWDLQQHDGPESELVEKIVKDVLKKLNHISSSDLEGLIGIGSRMKQVESLLCIGIMDVRFIGIWGMGGIGKTTIVRAIFDQIRNQFEGCCFLENVREKSAKCGLNRLQEELLFKVLEDGDPTESIPSLGLTFTKNRLRRKRVLIVLDDVDSPQQLKLLAGRSDWFHPGSRIIITSRDKQVLINRVDELYELEKLNNHEALQLFSLNAFRQNHPIENYMEFSSRVVYYAQGIPLALKVLGRFLFERGKQDWESTLKKLKKNPNMNIQNVLKISYDGLDNEEKEIFLDVACFFKGEEEDRVIDILNGCGFSTEIGISVLIDRCFITVADNMLMLHDLIQEMGRGIVRQESIKEPGKRSRLWEPQEILYLFKKNTGTELVESISLDLSRISELHLSSDAFMRMQNLRLLKFYSSHYHKGYLEDDKVHISQGLEFLPDKLRYLHWHRYPLKSLPSKFNPENLVELEMHHSNVDYLWKETRHLVNLRRIDLKFSRHLNETPDVTLAPNLEIMVLEGCSILTEFPGISWNIKELDLQKTAIEEVPSAVECLSKLNSLSLTNCKSLKNLPGSIRNLTSLAELYLDGCSNISKFPEISWNMKRLFLNETAIEELPSSVEYLTKLTILNLRNCRNLKRISSSLFKLKCLQILDFYGCSKLDSLPEILETMEKLLLLELQGTAIKELPSSIEHLTQLNHLGLANCRNITSLPSSLINLRYLHTLVLYGWSGVEKVLENLPSSLLSGFCSLHELNLSYCDLSELPSALSCLSSLEGLYLIGNNFQSLDLKSFSCLKSLDVSYCKRLQSMQDFNLCTNLEAHECNSLEDLPTWRTPVFEVESGSYQFVAFSNCFKLNEDAQKNILADAQLRIQNLAINAQKTASTEEYLKYDGLVASISICFPGSKIPGWFSHQNSGSFLTMELPQHWCSSKFLGFALCVVVAFDGYNDNRNINIKCKWDFETNEGSCNNIDSDSINFRDQKGRLFCSDHVFLLYDQQFYSMVVERDDDENWFSMYQSCLKASFEFSLVDDDQWPLQNCLVKNCGVCLLYSEEEQGENVDNFNSNEAEHAENKSNSNSDEEKEDPNTQTLEDNESNLEADAFWLAQGRLKLMSKIFLVGLALLFFLWCFLGFIATDEFSLLLPVWRR